VLYVRSHPGSLAICKFQIHVGNITGSYLPADIFARYQRLKGNQVAMVSGSDAHGTPVTVRAEAEGSTPVAVYQKFHEEFLISVQQLGLSYDLFTSTHTENHFKVSQGYLPGTAEEPLSVHRAPEAVVSPFAGPLPARPLCGRHLLYLRLPQCPRRPVR
jgi:hypothetical protein